MAVKLSEFARYKTWVDELSLCTHENKINLKLLPYTVKFQFSLIL